MDLTNLSKICRMCLKENRNMQSIFSKLDGLGEQATNLATIIHKVTHIPIELDDGFPTLVCKKCNSMILIAYDFIVQFDKSYEILSRHITKAKKIKSEPTDPPEESAQEKAKSNSFTGRKCASTSAKKKTKSATDKALDCKQQDEESDSGSAYVRVKEETDTWAGDGESCQAVENDDEMDTAEMLHVSYSAGDETKSTVIEQNSPDDACSAGIYRCQQCQVKFLLETHYTSHVKYCGQYRDYEANTKINGVGMSTSEFNSATSDGTLRKRARCKFCVLKKDRKTRTCCYNCGKFICKEHTTNICPNCTYQYA